MVKFRLNPLGVESMGQKVRTDFLFVSPSPWLGFARLLDIAGTFDRYNTSDTPEEADARAMFSDWRIVGQDLTEAMERVRKNGDRRSPEQLSLALR